MAAGFRGLLELLGLWPSAPTPTAPPYTVTMTDARANTLTTSAATANAVTISNQPAYSITMGEE